MSQIDQTRVQGHPLPMEQSPVGGNRIVETDRQHQQDPAEGPELAGLPFGESTDGETPGETEDEDDEDDEDA